MSPPSASAASRRPHPALADRRRAISRARGRRRRFVALIALAALAGIAGLYWVATGPLVAVHGVSMGGYERADGDELLRSLSAAAAEGTVLAPPTEAMRAAAAEFAWVDSISVSRRWPRALRVTVVPAVPVAVAAFEDQAVLVSARGRVLGVKDGTTGLGWLRLEQSPPAEGGTLPEGARAALAFVAAADPVVAARVRGLRVVRGGSVVGRVTAGPELRLGAPVRLSAKARALGLLLANLSPEEEAGASYIDLSVPERPALGGAI